MTQLGSRGSTSLGPSLCNASHFIPYLVAPLSVKDLAEVSLVRARSTRHWTTWTHEAQVLSVIVISDYLISIGDLGVIVLVRRGGGHDAPHVRCALIPLPLLLRSRYTAAPPPCSRDLPERNRSVSVIIPLGYPLIEASLISLPSFARQTFPKVFAEARHRDFRTNNPHSQTHRSKEPSADPQIQGTHRDSNCARQRDNP